MRSGLAALGIFFGLVLTSGTGYADDCAADGCSISCPAGCAAGLVNGRCVKDCADEDGQLPASFWTQMDDALARAKKAGKGISEILCFKGVANTRGRSGSQCR